MAHCKLHAAWFNAPHAFTPGIPVYFGPNDHKLAVQQNCPVFLAKLTTVHDSRNHDDNEDNITITNWLSSRTVILLAKLAKEHP